MILTFQPLTTSCYSFLDRNHVISIHYEILGENKISFQNTLPASFSGSDHLGCFNVDSDRRFLMLEMGMPIPNPDKPLKEVTKHTLYVSGDEFRVLSNIAAHPFLTPTSDTCAATTPPVVVVLWGLGHTCLTTMPKVPERNLVLQEVCGMHALSEPHILLDKRILPITDPHRVARVLAVTELSSQPLRRKRIDESRLLQTHSHAAAQHKY